MSRIQRTLDVGPHRTVADLAKAANVSQSAVLKWIREGRISAIKFGAAHRIPPEEFERVLREGVPPVRQVEERQSA